MVKEQDIKRMAAIEALWLKVMTCYRDIPEVERQLEGAGNHCNVMAMNGINEIAKENSVGGL